MPKKYQTNEERKKAIQNSKKQYNDKYYAHTKQYRTCGTILNDFDEIKQIREKIAKRVITLKTRINMITIMQEEFFEKMKIHRCMTCFKPIDVKYVHCYKCNEVIRQKAEDDLQTNKKIGYCIICGGKLVKFRKLKHKNERTIRNDWADRDTHKQCFANREIIMREGIIYDYLTGKPKEIDINVIKNKSGQINNNKDLF